MNKRYVIYPIVIVFSLTMLWAPQFLANPQRNFNTLARAVAQNPGKPVTKTFASWFAKNPAGYVLVLYTGESDEFYPTQYLVINKLNGQIGIDLINGVGKENVVSLKEDVALSYLKEHNLNIDQLESDYE